MESESNAGDSEKEPPPKDDSKESLKEVEHPNRRPERPKSRRKASPNMKLHKTPYQSAKMKKSAREDMSFSSTEEDTPYSFDYRTTDFPKKINTWQESDDTSQSSDEKHSDSRRRLAPHSAPNASKRISNHQSTLIKSQNLHNKSGESVLEGGESLERDYDSVEDRQHNTKFPTFMDSISHNMVMSTRGSLFKSVSGTAKSRSTILDADLGAVKSWSSKTYQQRSSIVMRVASSVRSGKADQAASASAKPPMPTGAEGDEKVDETAAEKPKHGKSKAEKEEEKRKSEEKKREKKKMEEEKKEKKKKEKEMEKEKKKKGDENIDKKKSAEKEPKDENPKPEEGKEETRKSLLLRNENGIKTGYRTSKDETAEKKPERASLLLRNQSMDAGGVNRLSAMTDKQRPSSNPEQGRGSLFKKKKSTEAPQGGESGAPQAQDDGKKTPRPSVAQKEKKPENEARPSKEGARPSTM